MFFIECPRGLLNGRDIKQMFSLMFFLFIFLFFLFQTKEVQVVDGRYMTALPISPTVSLGFTSMQIFQCQSFWFEVAGF